MGLRPTVRPRVRLLYVGEAELARQCLGRSGGSIEVLEAHPSADGSFSPASTDGSVPFDILLIEHGYAGADALAILRDLTSRKFHVPVVIVADWDENLAAAALVLGASDYVVKSRVAFRAIYFRLHRLMAHAALLAERTGMADGRSQNDRPENIQGLQQKLAENQAAREQVEQRLCEAIATIRQAREDRFTDAVAAAKELARRESGLTTKLKAAETTIRGLEQLAAEREADLRDAVARSTHQQATLEDGVRRQNELEATLAEEAERRCAFETRLEHANEALRDAAEQRLAEAAAFADRIDRYQTEAAASAAQMARQREDADKRLRNAVAAAEEARASRAAEAEAAARHLAEREETLLTELRAATDARDHLDRRLTDAATALRCAEQRVTAEHHAGQQRIAEYQAEFQAELSRQSALRDILRQQLAEAQRTLRDAEEARISNERVAAARLAELQAEHTTRLTEADAAQQALRHQLASVEGALEEATNRHFAETHEAAARLADQHAQFTARLSEADEVQAALRGQLSSVESTLREAIDRHTAETNDAAVRLADQQAHYAVRLTEADEAQEALRQHVASIEGELRNAADRHAGEMAAAAQRLAESREESEARLAQAAAALVITENKFAESEAARERAAEDHNAAIAQAADRLADHQHQSETRLAQAAAYANTLEAKLADTVATLQHLQQHVAIERQQSLEAASERQAEFDGHLAETVAKHQAVTQQLQRVEIAFQEARARHESETSEAAARFVEAQEKSEIRLGQADTAIKVAESKRAEALAALDRVVRQATAERHAASEDTRQRQAKFEVSLREEVERRLVVEKDLYDTRMAFEEARLQFVNEMAAATERHLESDARLEAQAGEERAAWDRARTAAEDDIRQLQAERERLHQSLVAAVQQIRRLESAQHEERTESERTRLALEGDLSRHREDALALQRTLDQTRTTAQETQLRASEGAARERSRLESAIADRDRELQEQANRAEAAAAAFTAVEEQLSLSRSAQERDHEALVRLTDRFDAATQELESTRHQREAFKATATRVPVLQGQIDEIRAINRREFEDTPVKRFRCSRTGAILQANAALARMLGYDTTGEVEALDFSAVVFESSDELQWLIDRCVPSRASQLIDTTWRMRDGSRIIVRVMAVATGEDTIDLVAEDVTPLRVVEEKLRYAQRMEAVARYGSEVAVTCNSLLTHVKQEGQIWLARMESDVARYQGQLLIDDVARAAGYLGQLAAYGEEQRNAPEVVEMNKVLHDLAPVLKRVAGDNVDIILPKTTTPLTLDVEARPVERMLVNVAAYGRERMPLGGRLMIDVDAVVVDREFVEKYPNVRPGAHVVLTVNEVRSAGRHTLVDDAVLTGSASAARTNSNPGVELGTLQALVRDCGGHLWMKAEPPGDMVLKIHLPRRVLDRSEPPAPSMARVRPRWLHRAFGARH